MYKHPEFPSYEAQIAARDHMLQRHPEIKFIGAHLGSLEWSVDELAKRLDQFPNMAVDMAARITHLQFQAASNRDKVRDFIIRYQDRLLYGTDDVITIKADFNKIKEGIHAKRISDWQFFNTDDSMIVADFELPFKGLQLPKKVIDKIYRTNAQKWYPGTNVFNQKN
jgi:predicted TIM-barrel fold metal-dependent hydrolase